MRWTRLISQTRNRGLAAVETALTLPLLLLLLVAAVDITDLIITDHKLIRASRHTADLVTREVTIDRDQLTDIVYASNAVFSPNDDDKAEFAVTSVRFDENGNTSVQWTESFNGGSADDPLKHAATFDLNYQSVIVTRARYEWSPLISDSVVGEVTLTETQVARPRTHHTILHE